MIELYTSAILSWLLTVFCHSTVLIGLVWVFQKLSRGRFLAVTDILWKSAVLMALLSATIQTSLPSNTFEATEAYMVSSPSSLVPVLPAENHAGSKDVSEALPVLQGTRTELEIAAFSTWATAAWILGFLAIALLRLRSFRRYFAILGDRFPLQSEKALHMAHQMAEKLGIKRRLRYTSTVSVISPVSIGFSEVCLPVQALKELSNDELRCVLAHELAHLRRNDPFWQIGMTMLETIFFFQPLFGLARRNLQTISEFACDQLSAYYTSSGTHMAASIVRVAQGLAGKSAPAAVCAMADRHSSISDRVNRLLHAVVKPARPALILVLLLCGATAVLGWMSPGVHIIGPPERIPFMITQNQLKPDRPPQDTEAELSGQIEIEDQPAETALRASLNEVHVADVTVALDMDPAAKAGPGSEAPATKPDMQSELAEQEPRPEKLSIDQLVKLKIHGVTAEFRRSVRKAGYAHVSVEALSRLKIHGVTIGFIQSIKALGYTDISLDELIRLKIHAIHPAMIKKLRRKGLKNLSVEKLIRLRVSGADRILLSE